MQIGTKLVKDCIKADILKTYKFQKKNNEFSCLQWPVFVQNRAVSCHLGPKLTDFAAKLAKVAAKLAEVGPSWPKVGLKLAPRCRQDGPKPVKSAATHNDKAPGRHQGARFRIQCPQGCPQIKSRMKEQSTGTARAKEQGTRDDEKI